MEQAIWYAFCKCFRNNIVAVSFSEYNFQQGNIEYCLERCNPLLTLKESSLMHKIIPPLIIILLPAIISLKARIHYESFLSEHFMKYSFKGISWNMQYFHEILLLMYLNFIAYVSLQQKDCVYTEKKSSNI